MAWADSTSPLVLTTSCRVTPAESPKRVLGTNDRAMGVSAMALNFRRRRGRRGETCAHARLAQTAKTDGPRHRIVLISISLGQPTYR